MALLPINPLGITKDIQIPLANIWKEKKVELRIYTAINHQSPLDQNYEFDILIRTRIESESGIWTSKRMPKKQQGIRRLNLKVSSYKNTDRNAYSQASH